MLGRKFRYIAGMLARELSVAANLFPFLTNFDMLL